MKYFFSIFIACTLSTSVEAQNTFPSSGAAGIGTSTPNSKSLLEVKSTTKGVLLPRMTQAQRNAIASPPEGLIIYQTDNTKGLYYYEGGWKATNSSGANKSLSNVTSPTALNVDLLPGTDSLINLGSASHSWKDLYLGGSIYMGGNRFISQIATGINSTAIGQDALRSNTTGFDNTAIGYQSLYGNTAGSLNTGIGYQALALNQSGQSNVAIGIDALYSNTFGSYNTAIGEDALYGTIGSEFNTAVGDLAGAYYDNGYNNVFVGAYANAYAGGYYNDIAIGKGTICTGSSQVVIGNSSTGNYDIFGFWNNISDGRYKKNVQENIPGLSFINKLRPVTYTLDATGIDNFLHQHMPQPRKPGAEEKAVEQRALSEKEQITYSGFIAQEVEKAAKEVNYDFAGVVVPKNDHQLYELSYEELIVPLVKAVQELSDENSKLKTQNANLEERVEKLESVFIQTKNTESLKPDIVLGQNIPNPCSKSTLIPFRIPKDCRDASIMITNTTSGEVIAVLPISCDQDHLSIDMGRLSSGTYSYCLYVDGKIMDTKQMMLAR